MLKIVKKNIYFGDPGDTKITKRRETMNADKTTIFLVPNKCQKGLIETPKWTWEASAKHAKVVEGPTPTLYTVARFQGVPPQTSKIMNMCQILARELIVVR